MVMLTPELVDQARELRANGAGWHTVAKRTGISEYILRVEIEPQYQEHRRAQHRRHVIVKKEQAEKRALVRARRRSITKGAPHVVSAFDRVPPDVLRDRDAREAAARERATLDQIVFGDPIPGYSALDQRARR